MTARPSILPSWRRWYAWDARSSLAAAVVPTVPRQDAAWLSDLTRAVSSRLVPVRAASGGLALQGAPDQPPRRLRHSLYGTTATSRTRTASSTPIGASG